MTTISNNSFSLHTFGQTLGNGIRNIIEGLGFGILTLLIYAIPMGIGYLIFQLLAN